MVVTLDITTVDNIHPPRKMEVGERLASLALANDYGMEIQTEGPVYKSMVIEGSTAKITFGNIGTGLFSPESSIPEFEVAGKEGNFVRASAKIVENEVWVTSPAVRVPETVRYCWRNSAEGKLFNSFGLPASQFRTKQVLDNNQ
jgi:sialate O-acetylesterase